MEAGQEKMWKRMEAQAKDTKAGQEKMREGLEKKMEAGQEKMRERMEAQAKDTKPGQEKMRLVPAPSGGLTHHEGRHQTQEELLHAECGCCGGWCISVVGVGDEGMGE